MAKCVIIPSIATSMLPPNSITLTFTKLEWSEFVAMLSTCKRIVNFVRHKPTVDLLSSVGIKFESGFEYKLDINDVILLIGLRTRAPTPGADVTVTADDLLIYLAKVQT